MPRMKAAPDSGRNINTFKEEIILTNTERIPVKKAIIELYKLNKIASNEQALKEYAKQARETGYCSLDDIIDNLISIL